MNKVTPLAPSFATATVVVSAPKAVSPANEASPSPTRLTDLFRQELVEFGPAMMMCDVKGQITWANAACRRINETRIDGGLIGERLRLGEIAEEIDLRRSTVFRDWDFAAAGNIQRLRARFEPINESNGQLGGLPACSRCCRTAGPAPTTMPRRSTGIWISSASRPIGCGRRMQHSISSW